MLVELHAGTIYAASEGRDKGAIFSVVLSLAAVTDQLEDLESRPNKDQTASPFGEVQVRVLVVEDHIPTRVAIVQLLKRRNYRVEVAGTVAEALTLAEKMPFDVLLSDIGLPDGDGYDLMVQLRDRYQMKGIALSGFGMEEDVIRSRTAGFGAHLTKPVNVRTLEGALASVQ